MCRRTRARRAAEKLHAVAEHVMRVFQPAAVGTGSDPVSAANGQSTWLRLQIQDNWMGRFYKEKPIDWESI